MDQKSTIDTYTGDLKENDFKVYQSPVDTMIIIRVQENESPTKCFIHEEKIHVITDKSRFITVPLPESLSSNGNISCSYYENLVVVKIDSE